MQSHSQVRRTNKSVSENLTMRKEEREREKLTVDLGVP